jgi:predicted nucleic-acid-binding Zn-ribbon protein
MDNLEKCPECGNHLHEGEHKYPDGEYKIKYCKKCGFRSERPDFKQKYRY